MRAFNEGAYPLQVRCSGF